MATVSCLVFGQETGRVLGGNSQLLLRLLLAVQPVFPGADHALCQADQRFMKFDGRCIHITPFLFIVFRANSDSIQ